MTASRGCEQFQQPAIFCKGKLQVRDQHTEIVKKKNQNHFHTFQFLNCRSTLKCVAIIQFKMTASHVEDHFRQCAICCCVNFIQIKRTNNVRKTLFFKMKMSNVDLI